MQNCVFVYFAEKQKEIKSIFSSCDKELEKCKDNLEAADKGEE